MPESDPEDDRPLPNLDGLLNKKLRTAFTRAMLASFTIRTLGRSSNVSLDEAMKVVDAAAEDAAKWLTNVAIDVDNERLTAKVPNAT